MSEEDNRYYRAEDTAIDEEEIMRQIEARRIRREKIRTRKKKRTVILLVIVFAMLLAMCSRDIVRLKAENVALKKQQKELTEERDRLKKELASTKDKEYVQEQARRQLRLLNEGEILFLFGEEEAGNSAAEEEE